MATNGSHCEWNDEPSIAAHAIREAAASSASQQHQHHHQPLLDQQNAAFFHLDIARHWYLLLGATTLIGFVVSLVSNLLIIYLFTSSHALRKNPSNIIAVNLSLSDLLYCLQWPCVVYCSFTQSTWILEYNIGK